MVEILRAIVVALLLADALLLPVAIRVWRRAPRSEVLVLGIDMLILSSIGRLVSHFHGPVAPYGLPVIGPAALVLSVYIAQALWAQHQGRSLNE